MAQKKYVSLAKLSKFLDNLRSTFALVSHKHTLSDISDYKVDTALSSTSNNPVANKIINEEFDAISEALAVYDLALDDKADISHTHDDRYYTEAEIDTKISDINTSIANITSGTTTVKEAEHADTADSASTAASADFATKASQDENGKVISSTYETKTDASAKLTEAKTYTDNAVAQKTQIQIITWGADD